MTKEIEEYKLKMENMEQAVAHYKEYMTKLSKFKYFTFGLEGELNTIQKKMPTNV